MQTHHHRTNAQQLKGKRNSSEAQSVQDHAEATPVSGMLGGPGNNSQLQNHMGNISIRQEISPNRTAFNS